MTDDAALRLTIAALEKRITALEILVAKIVELQGIQFEDAVKRLKKKRP